MSASPNETRLTRRLAALKTQGRKAFTAFVTAGDPDLATFAQILVGLPKSGADIIEIGVPFSDPMADGPAIQAANIRAFKAGISLVKILELVRQFRKTDDETPIVLMGYYNPIYIYGVAKFVADARAAGVDGVLVVDAPPEEDSEICIPATQGGLNFIRLLTPTSDAKRLPTLLNHASGFLYYVSIAGITGTKQANVETLRAALADIRIKSDLPILVGFGINTNAQVREIGTFADGVIVGSAIVSRIAANLDAQGKAKAGLVEDVLGFVSELTRAK